MKNLCVFVVFPFVIATINGQTNNSCPSNHVYHVQNLEQKCCCNGTSASAGGSIEDLKTQVAALQARIQTLEQAKTKQDFRINFCQPEESGFSSISKTTFLQSLRHGLDLTKAGYCQAVSTTSLGGGRPYELSARLLISNRAGHSHGGFLFNVIDEVNFDAFHFNPYHSSICWHQFVVQEGKARAVAGGPCPGGNPPYNTWFHAKLEVHNSTKATIRHNTAFIAHITPQFPIHATGGVANVNNAPSFVMFKDFQIKAK